MSPRVATLRIGAALLCALLGAGPAAGAESEVPADSGRSASVEGLLAELALQKAALDRRDRSLDERDRSIAVLEAEFAVRVAELEAIRKEVDDRIAEWTKHEDEQIPRLAKTYSAMPAIEAARLLERLDPDLATRVLTAMKSKSSAAVLTAMSRPHALFLSHRMARPLTQPRVPGVETGGGP